MLSFSKIGGNARFHNPGLNTSFDRDSITNQNKTLETVEKNPNILKTFILHYVYENQAKFG